MAQIVEMDQYFNKLVDYPALQMKIQIIVNVMKGDLPYSDYGNPLQAFRFNNPGVIEWIEGRLSLAGITARVTLTEKGHFTVYDSDVIYEGDLP